MRKGLRSNSWKVEEEGFEEALCGRLGVRLSEIKLDGLEVFIISP